MLLLSGEPYLRDEYPKMQRLQQPARVIQALWPSPEISPHICLILESIKPATLTLVLDTESWASEVLASSLSRTQVERRLWLSKA